MPVANSWTRRSAIYSVLVGFLCIAFLTGGSAGSDAVSLILPLPLAVVACAIALWRMPRVGIYRFLMLRQQQMHWAKADGRARGRD